MEFGGGGGLSARLTGDHGAIKLYRRKIREK